MTAPCPRPSCGRRRLARDIAMAATAVSAYCVMLVTATRPVTVPAAALSATAWAALAARRCPHGGDWIGNLMTDLGQPVKRLPRRWTPQDWAELEKELSK